MQILKGLAALFLTALACFAQASAPAPDGQFQFFDNNGLPLAGGKLCTYAAGTNTPLITYSDGLSTQNANPIIADASGRVNIWLQPLAYKFILMTAGTTTDCTTGTVLYTEDLISNAGQMVSAALPTYFAGGAGSALMGYKNVNALNVVTQAKKDGESLSLLEFGCVADSGTTDNAACITAGLVAAQAYQEPLLCPSPNGAGYYGVKTPISVTVTAALDFYGQGVSGCPIAWKGTATSDQTVKMLTLAGSGGPGLVNVPTTIRGITFGAVNNIGTLLGLDGVDNFDLDVQFNPAANVVNDLLCRSCQEGRMRPVAETQYTNVTTNAVVFTGLAGAVGTTPAMTTITSNINSGTVSIPVASCAGWNYGLNSEMVIDNEQIGGICSGTTYTVAANGGETGTPGTNPRRGDNATTPASHLSGATVTWLYNIPTDDVSIDQSDTYATLAGIWMDGGSTDSGKITVIGGHHANATYGILNTRGVVRLYNAHTEVGPYGIYQNGGAPYFDAPTTEVYGGWINGTSEAADIETGALKMYGGELAGGDVKLTSAAAGSVLNGVYLATTALHLNEADLSCTGLSYNPGEAAPPPTLSCVVSTAQTINPGLGTTAPSLTVAQTTYDGLTGNMGGGHGASVLVMNQTSAIKLAGNLFLTGNISSSGVLFCSTIVCSAGALTVPSGCMSAMPCVLTSLNPAAAIGAGPYSWIGGILSVANLPYVVTAVGSCADTVDSTVCSSVTITGGPSSGSGVAYTTVLASILTGATSAGAVFSSPIFQPTADYFSADGTGGVTGTTCHNFKNGICVGL